jgi:hypothetical protein
VNRKKGEREKEKWIGRRGEIGNVNRKMRWELGMGIWRRGWIGKVNRKKKIGNREGE